MRRLLFLAALLTLAGCSGFRDLFSAHADLAAEAAGQELPASRLAQILAAGGKGVRINRETGDFVANVWVDYALFGQAVARGQLPLDSASVAEAVWPEIAELTGNHWHDSLAAHRAGVSEASADSLYQSGGVRVLQHILFSVRTNSDTATKVAARKQAESTVARLRKGANFSALAAELSQDPSSRADSGYLPVSPKGRFVPVFDSIGWALAPGQISGIVPTPYGLHIIRRPRLAEIRDRLDEYLSERAGAHLDSVYMDSLSLTHQVEVLPQAPATMRAAAEDPDNSRHATTPLVRYAGGTLTVKDFLRWTRALPPQYMGQLKSANDTLLEKFARAITQSTILLHQADSAGVRMTPLEWATLEKRYHGQLDTLRSEMGLNGSEVSDSSVALSDREKLAGLKVEEYFDRLIAGKTRLRPLPSALATLLRDRLPYGVHDAGVNRAVELAADLKSKDTTAAKGAIRPAPGPAPIPGPPSPAKPAPKADTTAHRSEKK